MQMSAVSCGGAKMTDSDLIDFRNASLALDRMIAADRHFRDLCQLRNESPVLQTTLEVGDSTLAVEILGFRATAAPKYVSAADEFLAEYVFEVRAIDDALVEVWRCYVNSHGSDSEAVYADVELTQKVCDTGYPQIADVICLAIGHGVRERMYRPTPLVAK
jgi:hypothetical protein